jgi:hypothetical protein
MVYSRFRLLRGLRFGMACRWVGTNVLSDILQWAGLSRQKINIEKHVPGVPI